MIAMRLETKGVTLHVILQSNAQIDWSVVKASKWRDDTK